VDLDKEPLTFAAINMTRELDTKQRRRAATYRQDVRTPTIPRMNLVIAENFSFYIFKTRSDLLAYFRAAYASLENEGLLALDMVGGPGFIDNSQSTQRTLKSVETGLPSPVIY